MTLHVEFRPAIAADAGALQSFLSAAGLPADADPARDEFLLAVDGDSILGSAALQVRRGDALLSALAVAPAARGKGLGEALLARILAHARAIHVDTVWVVADAAEPWFAKRGFSAVERAATPPAIAASPRFKASGGGRCMRRALEG